MKINNNEINTLVQDTVVAMRLILEDNASLFTPTRNLVIDLLNDVSNVFDKYGIDNRDYVSLIPVLEKCENVKDLLTDIDAYNTTNYNKIMELTVNRVIHVWVELSLSEFRKLMEELNVAIMARIEEMVSLANANKESITLSSKLRTLPIKHRWMKVLNTVKEKVTILKAL